MKIREFLTSWKGPKSKNKKLPDLQYHSYWYLLGMQWVFHYFKPEFNVVIFIHYKPRIAVAILDL